MSTWRDVNRVSIDRDTPAFEVPEDNGSEETPTAEDLNQGDSVEGLEVVLLGGSDSRDELDDVEGFGEFENAEYAEEARERWGDTDAYRESMRRAKRYGKEEWGKVKAEGEAIEARWAELLAAGRRPEEDEVADVAEEYRRYIDRWFYPLTHEAHVGLAEMYTADPRFEKHYEDRAEGLAAFVAASIRANRARQGGAG